MKYRPVICVIGLLLFSIFCTHTRAQSSLGQLVKAGSGKTFARGDVVQIKAGIGLRNGSWQTLGLADGIPPGRITSLVKDRSGHLWLGGVNGIVQYNGRHFAHYVGNEHWTRASFDWLSYLLEDSTGRLWIVGDYGTGAKYLQGDSLRVFTEDDGLVNKIVWSVQEDSKGNIWFATDGGASRYDGTHFLNFTQEDGLPHKQIMRILEDSKGNIWFGTNGGGVSRYNGEQLTTFDREDGLTATFIRAMVEDGQGRLWFGGVAQNGLSYFDGETFISCLSKEEYKYKSINAIIEDHMGDLWFGTHEGLLRYDGTDFTAYTTEDGLPANEILSIVEDDAGDLWIGTALGELGRYDRDQFQVFTSEHGLPAAELKGIVEDRAGNLWIGSEGGGVSRFDGTSFQSLTKEDGLLSDTVRAIKQDNKGRLWFGSPGGVSYYDGKTFVATPIDYLGNDSVIEIEQDSKGVMWFGTGKSGVVRFDRGKYSSYREEDGLAGNMVEAIYEDHSGALWFGGQGGMRRFDGIAISAYPPFKDDGRITSIIEDKANNLWVSSAWSGAKRIAKSDVSSYTAKSGWDSQSGLVSLTVWDILEDNRGDILFATSAGLNLFDGSVFQYLIKRDGLGETQVTDLIQSRNGDLWLLSPRALTRYRPRHIAPAVNITNVATDENLGAVRTVKIPSSVHSIAFDYQAKRFISRPGEMQYKYRLKNYDKEWRHTRQERVEYTQLPPGQYEFEVRAIDRDLNYSEEPATVSVEVYYEPISSNIHISDLNIQDIFASFYKTYADKSVGFVRVTNDDPTPVEATLSFYIPDLMRRPTAQTVMLDPQSSQDIPLYALLDESVLELNDALSVQAEISLSCQLGEQTFSIRASESIVAYGRGALTWDELGRAAAFVTPTASNVARFARSLAENYRSYLDQDPISGNIPTAMLLFEALNQHGIQYARDSSTPYSQMREDRSAIDNIQYPDELLQSKMGDCDDCTVLFCSLLENLDIETAFIDHPNHILMMFDSGITEDQYFGFNIDEDQYIERNGKFWIPVEVTKLGEGSFMDAWKLGAKTWQRLDGVGQPIVSVREGWSEYPYALPSKIDAIPLPTSEAIEHSLLKNVESLDRLREEFVEKRYIGPLLQNPDNHSLRIQLAHALIQSGDFNYAISTLMSLLDTELKAEAYYLIGFSYAGKQNFSSAVRYVEKALEYEPNNSGYQYSLSVLKDELDQ